MNPPRVAASYLKVDHAYIESVGQYESGIMSDILGSSTDHDASRMFKEKERLGPWLSAWHDPVAGLACNAGCMQFMDLNRNGDYKLVVACKSQHLKVYQGTSLFAEHALLEEPSGLCFFHGKGDDPNRPPAVAVAAGPYIFIYRNLRPYYKFTAPLVKPAPREEKIWNQFRADDMDMDAATAKQLLSKAREDGVKLGPLSTDYLSVEGEENVEKFLATRGRKEPLSHTTVITCMSTIQRSSDEPSASVSLVAGTEDGQLVFLDPPGSVIASAQLPAGAAPAFLAVGGFFDADWRVAVACRENRVYTVKNGEVARTAVVTGTVIELETTPCGLVRIQRQLYVATTDRKLHAYHLKGRRDFTLKMPALVVQLEVVQTRGATCVLVALANGDVRLYNDDKSLLHTLQIREPIAALRFGPFAREEGSLAIVSATGKLSIFMLNRKATLNKPAPGGTGNGGVIGRPPEQDIPLKVPKKTKLYVEQTQREKEQAGEIHRAFQKDLCRLRLTAARAYVRTITDGQQGVSAVGTGASLRLHAKCQGLGPKFKIKLELYNHGERTLTSLPVVFAYDRNIYSMDKGQFIVSALLPGILSRHEISIASIDDGGAAGPVRVLVLSPSGPAPLVSAVVNMPLSELMDW